MSLNTDHKNVKKLLSLVLVSLVTCTGSSANARVHVWQTVELNFEAQNSYENPYTEVELWVRLEGPGFDKKVYGFWDGANMFKVRVLATKPGQWRWACHSNVNDTGLNSRSGSFSAIKWTEEERLANPNRRGFLRPTKNGHAYNYADGTPFFYLADTWWAASTWRYSFKGKEPDPDYIPGPGMGFEEAVQFRKQQGYNGVIMIASFPNWHSDNYGLRPKSAEGISLRAPWRIDQKAASMMDEDGDLPFEFPGKVRGFTDLVPDFDRINPAYFQNLDKKMKYLSDQGFVTFLEAVRRDHGPAWKHYYDWPDSYIRYVQYLIARYGCYNIIFSGVHLDSLASLPASDFNEALTAHFDKYGLLPFGQPHSTNIHGSTYRCYGHGADAPWLTMHGVGNFPRDHRVFELLEEMFHLPNPYPALNNEPFYPHSENPAAKNIHGDQTTNTRACAWGCVLNGALAGHIHGTQGYYVTTGESRQKKPYTWEALNAEKFFDAGDDMRHLKEFMLSEGSGYRDLGPHRHSLVPNQKPDGFEEWYLSGWSSMMRTPDAGLIIVYFEVDCPVAKIKNLPPRAEYMAQWFNPRTGEWSAVRDGTLRVNKNGIVQLPEFPGNKKLSDVDWALKMKKVEP